ATGAALAGHGRRVVTLVGDGSAAYTLQALWTQAREGLDVTTVVAVNHRYAILQLELLRAGGLVEGPGAALTALDAPILSWGALARGFGVPSRRVTDAAECVAALRASFATPGPMLIEALLP
ncbi:MAG: thiamine pyrophosphate-dependent enzyme, partial [Thermodesulfobacteriota bacterium]